jgi:hypothetical protein
MPTTWVAARYGLDPVKVNALRRAGELYAVRSPGAHDWVYPAWQFEGNGVKPAVAQFLAAARERGFAAHELHGLLSRRVGMVGGRRVVDLLLNEGPERAIATLR